MHIFGGMVDDFSLALIGARECLGYFAQIDMAFVFASGLAATPMRGAVIVYMDPSIWRRRRTGRFDGYGYLSFMVNGQHIEAIRLPCPDPTDPESVMEVLKANVTLQDRVKDRVWRTRPDCLDLVAK